MEESNLSNHPERYQLLFENSFEAMMIFEQDGNILEVNQQMADLVGYRVEELIGKKVYEFMLPIEREDAVGRAQKASTGQALPLVERTIIRKDGSKFVGEANLSPIMDEDGNVLFLFGVLRDLTERKKLEEELSEKETQLRQIGDNLPDGYIYRLIHKPDGQRSVSYISQGVERMYGVSVEEALQDINILYGMMLPEDLQAVIVAEEASIRNQERFNWDGRFRLRNGEINWSRYHSKPTVLPDGTRIWDGVALDITERKQAEKSLLESENTTRALLNALIDIALLTKPDGTILAGNQALADSLGETLDNLIGKNAFNYFPIEIAKARRARSAEVIKSGVPVQFEDTRNGRWFRNHIYPIMTNITAQGRA